MGHVRDVGCVLILLFGWAPLSSRNAPETSSVESATRGGGVRREAGLDGSTHVCHLAIRGLHSEGAFVAELRNS